jgi:hypothetical protein
MHFKCMKIFKTYILLKEFCQANPRLGSYGMQSKPHGMARLATTNGIERGPGTWCGPLSPPRRKTNV